MVYYLSDDQKQWVRNSGFEPLLYFCLEILPGKLAYNIFQIFDHNFVSLRLKNATISITDEDVFDVIGLPHGGEMVKLGPTEMFQERTKEWLAQFETDKEREQITPGKIVQLMKGQGLTQNFKLNFLIVFSNVLVGSSTNSYVDTQLLRLPGNMDQWYRYNWAEYLLNYLLSATESWNRTASVFFRGSLIFLTLFYVDRVRHKGIKLVDRHFPSFKGWTEEILKTRQSIELFDGVFGVGSVMVLLREFLAQNTQPSPKQNAADDNIQHKNCNGVEWNDQGWGQWDNAQHQANLDTWEKVYDKGWGQWDNDQEVPNIFEENIQETQMETENLEENEDNAKQHSENSETQNKQDDTEKDLVESIRVRAHDLMEEKLLFDTDLKIALQEYPNNHELLLIVDVINSVFHPRKKDSNAVNANEISTEQDQNETTRNETVIQDDYFQLRPEDIEEMELIGYVTRTKCTSDALDAFPSFSLGIDDEIIDKVCEDINAEEESNLDGEATEKDIFITPKPAIREKSTRLMRLTRYGKSPYIERVIDISSKFTNQDYGLWRFLIQNRDPLKIQVSEYNRVFKAELKALHKNGGTLGAWPGCSDYQDESEIQQCNTLIKLNEKRQPIMEEGLKLYNEDAANRVLNLMIQSSQLSQEEQRTDHNKRSPKKKTVTFAKNLTMTFEEEDQA
ncbi:hypothetical protein POM88_034662 [Heracleum sosnowskyi]|uniref:Aminotransferase-like plant mobile domain-containing protein n=1 Tax=Heracleum sosnowskyi TaxID=360622 RepID=A0AAD8HJP4_9APIA|nr:hypothetical protein POM88_034662 [Heracleum sosnowskyi]